jgi:aminopeptidase N
LDVATSDDLRQAFLEATGENLAWFWDLWVYQAGFPEFTIAAAWDSIASVVTLQVTQVQPDTLKADSTGLRYSVPPVFRMPVAVRVGTSSGDVVAHAMLTDREQTIRMTGVTTAPTMVIFDDGNTILKRLTFDQPTTWLASQLSHDPNLWNRAWVIDQLAERRNDTEALAALLHAATNADYFLTRMQAVTTLGAFQGPGVIAGLLEALKDSSAQVRAAAAAAVAAFPTEEVRTAVRRMWERDTSYLARAAALGALARLEPQYARALFREGLSTPSYQGSIQDAALAGIVQTADTALLDEVDGALSNNRNAAYVLAAFASHGNARALVLLEQRLRGPRATVRDWALQAFRFGMPPALALERLSALLAETPPGVLRDAVMETVERLRQ